MVGDASSFEPHVDREWRAEWKKLDTRGRGTLSFAELPFLLKGLGVELTDDELEDVAARVQKWQASRMLIQGFLRWWTGDGGLDKLCGESEVRNVRSKVREMRAAHAQVNRELSHEKLRADQTSGELDVMRVQTLKLKEACAAETTAKNEAISERDKECARSSSLQSRVDALSSDLESAKHTIEVLETQRHEAKDIMTASRVTSAALRAELFQTSARVQRLEDEYGDATKDIAAKTKQIADLRAHLDTKQAEFAFEIARLTSECDELKANLDSANQAMSRGTNASWVRNLPKLFSRLTQVATGQRLRNMGAALQWRQLGHHLERAASLRIYIAPTAIQAVWRGVLVRSSTGGQAIIPFAIHSQSLDEIEMTKPISDEDMTFCSPDSDEEDDEDAAPVPVDGTNQFPPDYNETRTATFEDSVPMDYDEAVLPPDDCEEIVLPAELEVLEFDDDPNEDKTIPFAECNFGSKIVNDNAAVQIAESTAEIDSVDIATVKIGESATEADSEDVSPPLDYSEDVLGPDVTVCPIVQEIASLNDAVSEHDQSQAIQGEKKASEYNQEEAPSSLDDESLVEARGDSRSGDEDEDVYDFDLDSVQDTESHDGCGIVEDSDLHVVLEEDRTPASPKLLPSSPQPNKRTLIDDRDTRHYDQSLCLSKKCESPLRSSLKTDLSRRRGDVASPLRVSLGANGTTSLRVVCFNSDDPPNVVATTPDEPPEEHPFEHAFPPPTMPVMSSRNWGTNLIVPGISPGQSDNESRNESEDDVYDFEDYEDECEFDGDDDGIADDDVENLLHDTSEKVVEPASTLQEGNAAGHRFRQEMQAIVGDNSVLDDDQVDTSVEIYSDSFENSDTEEP